MNRLEYIIKGIWINGVYIQRVVIDQHVRKHKDIDDLLILNLARQLDGIKEKPEATENGFSYFANKFVVHNKQYKLVWLLEENKVYIGVVTAYRDNRKKD
jgi:hypothetical protein